MCKRDDERDILTVSDGVGRRAKRDFVDRPIIELLCHLSAGLQKCCLKPLQSLFSFDFGGPSYLWFAASHFKLARSRLLTCVSFFSAFFSWIFEQERDCSLPRAFARVVARQHDVTQSRPACSVRNWRI